MEQKYEKYTAEDHEVWGLLMSRQLENLSNKACKEYLAGVEDIGFSPERVPDFRDVNAKLMDRHGWSIEVVPGIIPAKEFFALLAKKKFCSSTWLRSRKNMDYLEEPDMFHDAFGHLPMLMNDDFTAFATRLAELAQKFPDEESILKLQRIYWFSIEFGLTKENDELRAYGAGICSSFGETNYSLSGEPKYLDFDIFQIMDTPFYTDHIQDKYFVLPSIPFLRKSLEGVEAYLHG